MSKNSIIPGENLNQIIDFISGLARLEFDQRLAEQGNEDYDAIASGLNWLAEEFAHNVVSKNQLEKKNQELEQFAYIASHDLKAPLRAIGSLATFIDEDLKDGNLKEVHENLDLIRGRAERMQMLIVGILAYSKTGEPTKEDIDLNQVIKEISSYYSDQNHVSINIESDLPAIFADRVQIQQVFSNLISNGIKYNDKEKIVITIEVEENDHTTSISVRDNGPGIGKEYFSKVFEMFQTLQSKDSYESTGVGLTIVKKIANSHQGDIAVASDGKLGTTFTFTLPNKTT